MGKTDQNHSTRVVMANLKAVMVVINNKDTNKDTILDMADMVHKVVTTSKHKGMVDITNKDTDNSNKAMVSNNKDKMVNKAMDNSNKNKMANRAMDSSNKARTDSKDMDNSRARTTRDTVNNKDNNSKDNSSKLWEIIINKETPVMVQ